VHCVRPAAAKVPKHRIVRPKLVRRHPRFAASAGAETPAIAQTTSFIYDLLRTNVLPTSYTLEFENSRLCTLASPPTRGAPGKGPEFSSQDIYRVRTAGFRNVQTGNMLIPIFLVASQDSQDSQDSFEEGREAERDVGRQARDLARVSLLLYMS
jgi:hypothetical protein